MITAHYPGQVVNATVLGTDFFHRHEVDRERALSRSVARPCFLNKDYRDLHARAQILCVPLGALGS